MRSKLLWIDGSAALVAGLLVLMFSGWLAEFYSLPQNLLIFTGIVNLLYASYSLPLAARRPRSLTRIQVLAAANLSWTAVCIFLGLNYLQTASLFGLLHLFGEGIFVSGLGILEWRWREFLQTV